LSDSTIRPAAPDLVQRAQAIIRREAEAVLALADHLEAQDGLAEAYQMLLDCPGHVLVTGAGTSRAVAERFAHLLSCCGTPALFISAADSLHGGAGAITAQDVVFVISKGGQSAEINKFVEIARTRGARIIAQTENPASPLAAMSDVLLHLKAIGGVDPYGFIATGSSLVNAAMGDALCVLLLDGRGYTLEQFGRTHPEGAVGRQLGEAGR